jgi:Carboxypeptidase regulatory-like domain
MQKFISSSALLLLGAVTALASIDGTVVNGTSGKPAPKVSITLLKPGAQGMKTLGTTTTDSTGHFVFENDQPGGGPQLLQASYKGVTYNRLLTPNVSTSNVEVQVYEPTKSPAAAKVSQRMLVVEPSSSRVNVNETVLLENGTKTTYNNDALGAIEFYLPPAANGQVRVNAQGPQGMPLPRAAEKTDQTDIFKVNFPVKPGETQIQIAYVLSVGSPLTFRGRVVNIKGMPAGNLRLVAPPGVILSGKDIQPLGTEPQTRASIYDVRSNGDFSVDVAGTGSLQGGGAEDSADESEGPKLSEGQPPIYRHLPLLISAVFAILGVGLILLFRSSPVRSPSGR